MIGNVKIQFLLFAFCAQLLTLISLSCAAEKDHQDRISRGPYRARLSRLWLKLFGKTCRNLITPRIKPTFLGESDWTLGSRTADHGKAAGTPEEDNSGSFCRYSRPSTEPASSTIVSRGGGVVKSLGHIILRQTFNYFSRTNGG